MKVNLFKTSAHFVKKKLPGSILRGGCQKIIIKCSRLIHRKDLSYFLLFCITFTLMYLIIQPPWYRHNIPQRRVLPISSSKKTRQAQTVTTPWQAQLEFYNKLGVNVTSSHHTERFDAVLEGDQGKIFALLKSSSTNQPAAFYDLKYPDINISLPKFISSDDENIFLQNEINRAILNNSHEPEELTGRIELLYNQEADFCRYIRKTSQTNISRAIHQ